MPPEGPALVTGASSGIGAAIVRALRAHGREVVALARRADRLAALERETGCSIVALDVRQTERLTSLVREIEPSVIVNNAARGLGYDGLEATSAEEIDEALAANVGAPFHAARAALPAMRRRGSGHIVNIGSIAGLYALNNPLYGATKGALHLMAMNLRLEVKGSGIRVTIIAPGRTATEFYDAGGLSDEAHQRLTDTGIAELQPDDVAACVLFALNAPPHVNVSLLEVTPTGQVPGGTIFTAPHPPAED